ncbi:MAG: hypothetical protein A3F17_07265 [Gammaproteobacteria bacterium RIFCSPHIGHO2_12_FULL_41_15]|nr:MAG: hypothetical protein A3F17_07265 [Gammaproteobacteria bacterium RIFCSPHIGHO2_12_FULL_41_15]
MMWLKILIIVLLAVILYCLGSGLYYLVRGGERSLRLVKALTWRVILSFSLFAIILLAYFLGWIQPHSLINP